MNADWPDEAPFLVRLRADRGPGKQGIGAGVVVAESWVLTAWHVVSLDGEAPKVHDAEACPAASIDIECAGQEIRLDDPEFLFATSDVSGSGRSEDLALVRIEGLSAEPARLWRGLGEAEATALRDGTGPGFRMWGFPTGVDLPEPGEFRPTSWDPDLLSGEAGRLMHRHGGIAGGFSGGPLLACVEDGVRWVGVTILGGQRSAFSGYLLPGLIGPFLEEALSKAVPDFGDLGSVLLRRPLERMQERCAQVAWSNELELDQLFVERVVAEVEEPRGRAKAQMPSADAGAPKSLSSHLGLDAEPVPVGRPRCVLRGEPGSGKSTILRQLASELAGARGENGERRPVGLYLRLPDLDETLGTEGGWSALSTLAGEVCGRYLRALLDAGDPRGELVLLLDGYDEVSSRTGHRKKLHALLSEVAERLPRTPVVVATRSTSFDPRVPCFRDWQLLRVEPLGRDRQLELLRKLVTVYEKLPAGEGARRVGPRELEAWVDRIQDDSRFDEERGNPLWLTLGALVIAIEGRMPESRTGLIRSILAQLEAGVHRRDPETDPYDHEPLRPGDRDVLRALAYRMTEAERVQVPRSQLLEWARELTDDAEGLLERLHRNSILAPPTGSRGGKKRDDEPWSFWHRSIQEFLSAEVLLERWESEEGRDGVLGLAKQAADGVAGHLVERLGAAVDALAPHREVIAAIPGRGEGTAAFLDGLSDPDARARLVSEQEQSQVQSFLATLEDWVAQLGSDEEDSAASDADDHARFWSEPLGMLAEMLPDREGAEALFEQLADTDQIGRRALLSSDAATERSVDLVLAKLSDEEDRGSVIAQAPRLLGDSRAALRWLRRTVRSSAVRADAHFADEALRALAGHDPELTDLVRSRRRRMFRTLVRGSLPSGLFESVDDAGEVPLWREIPAGSFRMGEGEEARDEAVDAPFWLAATPVTQAQYKHFDPSYSPSIEGPKLPAIEVSWYAAQAFCRWLGLALGLGRPGFLPSEVEWEYACRGGGSESTEYWFGDDEKELDQYGWHLGNSGERPHPVATSPADERALQRPNPWGLFDMHGNVSEWCRNRFDAAGPGRAVRGGGCWNQADFCRSAWRVRVRPGLRNWYLGFRVALPAPPARGSNIDL